MARKRRYQSVRPRLEQGQWKLRYRDESGRKRTKCFGTHKTTTRTEAYRASDDFLREINRITGRGLALRERTVQDVVEQWKVAVRPALKLSTTRIYDWVAGKLGEPAGGMLGANLAALSRADVQEWLLAQTDYSPRTLRLLKAAVSGLLSHAVDWGWLNTNPAYGRYRMLPTAEKVQRPSLSPQQVGRLAGYLSIEPRTVFLVALLTGLRKCELSGLWRSDVQPGVLTVSRKWDYNGKCGDCRFGPPKNGKARTVEIGPAVYELLQEWYAVAPKSELVFPGRGGGPKHLGAMLGRIQPVCRRLGLPEITWHDLRANYTTWGRKVGVSAEVMRDQLGHSSIVMTLDVYAISGDRENVGTRVESLLAVPQNVEPKCPPTQPQLVH